MYNNIHLNDKKLLEEKKINRHYLYKTDSMSKEDIV